jgi:hypothetical protein
MGGEMRKWMQSEGVSQSEPIYISQGNAFTLLLLKQLGGQIGEDIELVD